MWLKVKTPREGRGPSNDLSSRPRFLILEIGLCLHHRCIIQTNWHNKIEFNWKSLFLDLNI